MYITTIELCSTELLSTSMRYALFTLLIFAYAITATGQYHLLGDIGYTPGVSITYNYELTKHLAAGIGLQSYMYPPTGDKSKKFTTGLYADLRINIRTTKKNQFFTFFNFGVNLYKQDKSYDRDSTHISHYPHNNGFCFNMGLGYFRKMTKRGGGPYLALKMVSNWYTIRGYSIISKEDEIGLLSVDARPVIALGFKF